MLAALFFATLIVGIHCHALPCLQYAFDFCPLARLRPVAGPRSSIDSSDPPTFPIYCMLFPISRLPRAGKNQSNPSTATTAGVLEPKEALEHFAYRFGRSYDSYLVTNSGRQQFWANNGAGVVAYVQSGKYLHVGGGLLAAAKHQAQLLAEFVEFALSRLVHLVLQYRR